ncbi:hypothetical protein ACFQDG_01255 [Natronoarchaeum mannanilyticum]|uniref:hypothetical protein n=1 Tax=Natronoarchaeum mannanilyticum TaxID=926360 RepID=UPI00361AD2FC
MAQNPIGTAIDRDRMVELGREDGAFVVDVAEQVETADLPDGAAVVWRLRKEGDVARLALVPVPEDEVPDDTVAGRVGEDESLPIPRSLITEGLELDPEAYDPENPLLFKRGEIGEVAAAAAMPTGAPAPAADTALELQPVRFADGTPFHDEPVPEESLDSDPIAEAELERDADAGGEPQSGTVSAPIDSSFVNEVLTNRGVDREQVIEVLEAIARHDLIGPEDDATEYDPLTVDDRAVIVVDADVWEAEIAPEVDVERDALDAARKIHHRQAADLYDRANADEEREIAESRDAVVVKR